MISPTLKQSVTVHLKKSVLLFLVLSGLFYSAQNTQTTNPTPAKIIKPIYCGMGLEFYASGDAHGGYFSGYASVSRGKGMLTIGPVMQKRSKLIKGARLGFTFKLAGLDLEDKGNNTGTVGLKIFSYIQFVDVLPLSFKAAETERMVNTDSTRYNKDWNKVLLSTGEMGIGIEIHIRIAKAITWKNYLGLSTSYRFNHLQGMYNEKVVPALIFGTGINIPRFKM